MSELNRPAPAYQEYAASVMARTDYRVMGLAERGLFYSLRLECWVNRSLPADPEKLARILGFDISEVSKSLPAVLCFFSIEDGVLTCPELENYRAHLEERRVKQIEGGKLGAKRRYARKPSTDTASRGVGNLQDTHGSTYGSLVQYSTVQHSKEKHVHQRRELDSSVNDDVDEWVKDFSAGLKDD